MSKMKTRGGPMSMQDGTTRGKKQESLTPRDVTEDKDKGGGVGESRRKTGEAQGRSQHGSPQRDLLQAES